jgi:HAE1 family hydrophobic/amphiphilic exporter-1
LNVKDVLARVPGVGEVEVMGSKKFAMRVWLDPEKLRARQLTTDDVVTAIRQQNVEVAAGQVGGPPSSSEQQFQFTVKTLGRLSTEEQFGDIILRVEEGGRLLRLKDVARMELGAESYYREFELSGQPGVAVAVYAIPGANALEVARGVRAALAELAKFFPEGLHYTEPYNPTAFIIQSLWEVFWSLLGVVMMVILTIYVFLMDWRASLVPTLTIPISLIGTLAVMMALGISINTLSLFGLVLAIGIVVDDAIVVVENCSRLVIDEKLSPRDAAIKGMQQVTGPVIATTLVLLAVFVPVALSGGIMGRLYRQFTITLSVAVMFSTLNALTLSPVLCRFLLRTAEQKHGRVFLWFDRFIHNATSKYANSVRVLLRRTGIILLLFIAVTVLSVIGFGELPTGFLPDEDEGSILIGVRLPEGASLVRTKEVVTQITQILHRVEGVHEYGAINGFSFMDMAVASNGATIFVNLKPWSERKDPQLHVSKIAERLQKELSSITDALCLALLPPPIQGLGLAGGFEVRVQDRGGAGYEALARVGSDFVFNAMNDPVITRLNNSFFMTSPQIYVDIDRIKAQTLDIPMNTVFDALQTYLGSTYVNDFNIFSRTFRVVAQADEEFRNAADDIGRLEVRNRTGQMIPLRTLVTVQEISGPKAVTRYNMYPSTTITGVPQSGYSTGQAIQRVEELLKQSLPSSMGYEWSGMSYQEVKAGGKMMILFLLSSLFAYLFLAAQYESWTVPVAIVLAVPLGLLGAALFTWIKGLDNNIYTQMGIILLVGTVCKTSILLVEFAKQLHEQGMPIREAAVEAARIRFRPILMTALTTGLGMVPLMVASGAGAAARQAIGTTVFGGMIMATLVGVFVIPVFYVVVESVKERTIAMERKVTEAVHHQKEKHHHPKEK